MKVIVFMSLLVTSFALAAADKATEPGHIMMKPEEMKWVDAPPSLPKGAKVAPLFGDPAAAAPFAMRLKFPANYTIPPHFHPQDENVTVISGAFAMGHGDDAKGKTTALPPGSFARMTAGTHHFARAEKETVVQINSVGPWGITYINPGDDPRKK